MCFVSLLGIVCGNVDTSVLTEQADLQMVVSGIRELSFVDQKHLFLMGCSWEGMVSAMEVADHPHDYADTFIRNTMVLF